MANGVSLIALDDWSLARDGEADPTLQYLLKLPLQALQFLLCHFVCNPWIESTNSGVETVETLSSH